MADVLRVVSCATVGVFLHRIDFFGRLPEISQPISRIFACDDTLFCLSSQVDTLNRPQMLSIRPESGTQYKHGTQASEPKIANSAGGIQSLVLRACMLEFQRAAGHIGPDRGLARRGETTVPDHDPAYGNPVLPAIWYFSRRVGPGCLQTVGDRSITVSSSVAEIRVF